MGVVILLAMAGGIVLLAIRFPASTQASKVWGFQAGQHRLLFRGEPPAFGFSEMGRQTAMSTAAVGDLAYVTLSDSDRVTLVDTDSHFVGTVNVGAAGCDFPWRAAMSPDGEYVYVSCYDSDNVVIIETAGNTVAATVWGIPGADGIAFVREGAYALVGSQQSPQIVIVDTTTHFIGFIDTPAEPRSVVAHPYLDKAYASCTDGTVLVIDTATFSIITAIPVGSDPWDVAISPDGGWVLASDRSGDGLAVIDTDSNSLHSTVTGLGDLAGLEVAPDGSEIYACGLDSGVHVIDGQTFAPLATISGVGTAWEVAITCDGSELYVGNSGGQVPVVDVESRTVADQITMTGIGAQGIAIRPQYVPSSIILSPRIRTEQGARGQKVAHQERVLNASGATDSISLTLGSHAWEAPLSIDSLGPIADGEWATFTLYVTVPAGVDWYDTDVVVVTATSATSPTIYSDTAILTTQAYAPPQMAISPQALNSTQYVNEIVTKALAIDNGNGVTLTFKLVSLDLARLVLWNKLGSEDEVLHSAYGPGFGTRPGVLFVPGRFGGALATEGGENGDGGYLTMSPDLFYPADRTRGTVEGWIQKRIQRFIAYQTPLVGIFGAQPYDDLSSNLTIIAYWSDGVTGGGGLHFQVRDKDNVIRPANDVAWDQVPMYQWVHVAFVWDVGGIGGTQDRLRIYRDGVLVAANQDDFATVRQDSRIVKILGHHAYSRFGQPTAYLDNLKVWNYAKTDFSDRFIESPFDAGASWLSTVPLSGTVGTNGGQNVAVIFDATGLQPGVYTTTVAIQSNDPANPEASIPVTMTVLPTANPVFLPLILKSGP
jgi:YVTN family beta-propeller protein